MKIYFVLGVLVLVAVSVFLIYRSMQSPISGNIQVVPDAIKTNDTNLIGLILYAPINSSPLNPRYSNISLKYRLVGESTYKSAKPIQAPLPESDNKLTSKDNQNIKYNFYLDLYPKGTTGEVEYYIDLNLDNKNMRLEGIKKIKLVD
jgi:hypothetical protein